MAYDVTCQTYDVIGVVSCHMISHTMTYDVTGHFWPTYDMPPPSKGRMTYDVIGMQKWPMSSMVRGNDVICDEKTPMTSLVGHMISTNLGHL